jgi:hypothetical protein
MTEIDSFSSPASEETLQHVAAKLQERNIEAIIVDNADEAREQVLERLPKGVEVHSGKSKTLADAGITDIILDPNEYDALRPRYMKMDRQTQSREIRKMTAGPDYMLGSVNALTQDGILVVTSALGNQLGPYAGAAGKVILVVGSQKIVPDLETALRRIREYVFPWEDVQVRKIMSVGTIVGKTLIIEREWKAGRMTVVLVRTPIGV